MSDVGIWTMTSKWQILLAICFAADLVRADDYCYMDDANPITDFGFKTAYERVHGKYSAIEKCKPSYIWALISPGTSYMNSEEISYYTSSPLEIRDQIVLNHEVYRRGSLCSKDLEALKQWQNDIDSTKVGKLTKQGYRDIEQIAKRLRDQYKDIIDLHLAEEFEIVSSTNSQAKKTAMIFTKELFHTDFETINGHRIKQNDDLVDTTSRCYDFLRSLKPRLEDREEYFGCPKNSKREQLMRQQTKRLGYKNLLPTNSTLTMYHICAHESAHDVTKKSSLCAAFTNDYKKYLDYVLSVEAYYQYGYGNPYSEKLGTALAKDMITKLIDAGKENPVSMCKGAFYFTSTPSVITFLTRLGLFKDTNAIKCEDYDKNLKWKISRTNPFAGNIIVVLHKCQDTKQVLVQFYSNENLITDFPGCKDGICTLDILKKKYEAIFKEDEALDFCQEKVKPSSSAFNLYSTSNIAITYVLALLLLFCIE